MGFPVLPPILNGRLVGEKTTWSCCSPMAAAMVALKSDAVVFSVMTLDAVSSVLGVDMKKVTVMVRKAKDLNTD